MAVLTRKIKNEELAEGLSNIAGLFLNHKGRRKVRRYTVWIASRDRSLWDIYTRFSGLHPWPRFRGKDGREHDLPLWIVQTLEFLILIGEQETCLLIFDIADGLWWEKPINEKQMAEIMAKLSSDGA